MGDLSRAEHIYHINQLRIYHINQLQSRPGRQFLATLSSTPLVSDVRQHGWGRLALWGLL